MVKRLPGQLAEAKSDPPGPTPHAQHSPGLAELQAAFQAALLSGDDLVLSALVDSPHEARGRLLSVYRSAYRLRLLEFLRNDFPVLLAHAGAEEFAALSAGYIAANISSNPNARWYGKRLPGFLAATPPWSERRECADIASLEWALGEVFDAADDRRLVIADLAVLQPEDWPGVSFSPHPATRRINLATNARAIWRSLTRGEPAPAVERLVEPDRLVAFRPDLTSMLRPMSYEEAMMWDEMANGITFGVLCEMVAMYGGDDDAAARAGGYLTSWIAAGMLAGPAG